METFPSTSQSQAQPDDTFAALLWLLQVNDSQFPSGAYAHSMGLEGLVQRELIRRPDDLESFLHQQIIPSLCAFELPFLIRAHALAKTADLNALRALDDELEAWKLAAEIRHASRQLGSRRLAMLLKLDEDSMLNHYADSDAPCHHLIICAIELREQPLSSACCAFSYQTISGYTSASMKLMRLGQERCQGILRSAMRSLPAKISEIIQQQQQHSSERVGWFNPLLEISSMRHARANERLFIS